MAAEDLRLHTLPRPRSYVTDRRQLPFAGTFCSEPQGLLGSLAASESSRLINTYAAACFQEHHNYKYVLHEELPLPDREAHYSKMLVIHQAPRKHTEAHGSTWKHMADARDCQEVA